MTNYGEGYYPEDLKEPLSYRLSADVDVDDLFKFIIENIPYAKVIKLRNLLNEDFKNVTIELLHKLSEEV